MVKNENNVELLLPAGSFEKALYAMEFGADAIYCGIPMFTLRGKSTMSLNDLRKLMPIAREKGVKVYFAVNIFPHSFKYNEFLKIMEIMVNELKPDAFIMSDPGLIDVALEKWPNIEIHLSVQANTLNWMSVKFWKKIGIKRVILARELTLEEIKEIHNRVPDMELEFFIHGSNCVAYSGRCLLSNYFNYRDSNQGVCNNACRFKYKIYKGKNFEPLGLPDYKKVSEGTYYIEEMKRRGELYEIDESSEGTYILNARDNCMVEYLKDLLDAGVCSFKVEGRTKSVYYTAIVARTYRKIIDQILKGEKPDINWAIKELNTTSNRGFTPGFLMGNPKELAIEYERKCAHQTHSFVGVVKDVKKIGKFKIDALILDFDGVIVNTLNETLKVLRSVMPEITKKQFLEWIKGNVYNSDFNSIVKERIPDFFEKYSKLIINKSINLDLINFIKDVKDLFNCKVLINSSTPSKVILKYLKKFKVDHLFDEIYGSDVNVSKVEKFKLMFNKYSLNPQNCYFITDTVGDLKEAKVAGVKSIAVTFGFHTLKDLIKNKPDLVLSRDFLSSGRIFEYFKSRFNRSLFSVILEPRSKFSIGDSLEFVMPLPYDVKNFTVDFIKKETGELLDSVSGGVDFLVRLEVPFEVNKFCVVRKRL